MIKNLEEAADGLLENVGSPPLIVLSLNPLEFHYGIRQALKVLSMVSAWTRRNSALSLWIDKMAFPELTKRLASVATIHFKLTRRRGCLLLYGVKPRTPLYSMSLHASKGYGQVKLTSIM